MIPGDAAAADRGPVTDRGVEAGLLLRELLATAREPLLLLDAGYRVLAASAGFHSVFRLQAEEVLGKSIYEVDGGAWNEPAFRNLLEERAAREEMIERVSIRFASGRVPPVKATVRPVRGGMNRIQSYILLLGPEEEPSATPDRNSLDALTELVARHATDLLVLYDREGRCLYAGPAAETMLGYEPSELQRMTACELVHPSNLPEIERVTAAIGGGELPRSLVWRIKRKGGGYTWLETTLRRIQSPEWPDAILTSSRDVSARRRTEEALQWLGRQTKLILDSAGEGIFGVDKGGKITFVNPAAARMLGSTVQELLGAPYREFVAIEEEGIDPVREALDEGARRRSDSHSFRMRGGGSFPVEFTCTPAIDTGVVAGAVITFRDITDRLEALTNLRRAERLAATAEMVMAMRHEINNPLTTLLAEASMLEMGDNDPAEEREMIASIAEQARRIRDAIRTLGERADIPAPP